MKVSVCIPTYNQSFYLEQAIRSAAMQTVLPFEIIVSDDASTDDTKQILERLSTEICNLKINSQVVNKGISENTNTCLRMASGDFIVRLDSDDYLLPDYIKTLSALLEDNPSAGYAHASVQEISANGDFLKKRKLFREDGYQSADDSLKASAKGYRVAANIIMFRRQALESVNYLHGRPNFGEDYHLAASIARAKFGNVYSTSILSCYRVWIDTGGVRQKRKIAEIDGLRKVFTEVLEPAYLERGWNIEILKRSRSSFACAQSDCIGWNIYSNQEKNMLTAELLNLSSSFRVKFNIWLYTNGLKKIIHAVGFCKSLVKKIGKKTLAPLLQISFHNKKSFR